MNEAQMIMRQAEKYVEAHVGHCARELEIMSQTCILPEGGYVRFVEEILKPLGIGSVHSLAVSLVHTACIAYAAKHA